MSDWTIVGIQLLLQALLLAIYAYRINYHDWGSTKPEPSMGLFLFSVFVIGAASVALQVID